MGFSAQDTFYVDPRVDGCDSLSCRAKRLGLKTRGFLGEGVTVCVAASSSSAPPSGGGGRAGDEAAAAASQSRGRRLSRIHRMVTQAQTDPALGSETGVSQHHQPQHRRQRHTSIADQARQLRAAVVSGQAFRLWLERQESARGTAGGGTGGAGARRDHGGRSKAAARALTSRVPGAGGGASRFKSQDHPRVVIKDLDGLEADRVQAFPPELLRKCNLYTDAPPGICPFTPREQWEREVLKAKKKDAQFGTAKVAARTPPAGALKPRRGGWCECCQRSYIGTMTEHCAGEQHRTAVTADPNYAELVAFGSWTGAGKADAEGTARNAGFESPPQTATDAPIAPAAPAASSPRLPNRGAAAAVTAGAADATAGGDDAINTVAPVGEAEAAEAGLVTGSSGREQGLMETPAPTAKGEGSQHARGGEKSPATHGARSPLSSRGQVECASSPASRRDPSRRLAEGTREGRASDIASTSPKAISPPQARRAAGAMVCARAVRSSPRRSPRSGRQGEAVVLGGDVAGAASKAAGGGGGGRAASPGGPTTAQLEHRGSLSSRRPTGGAASRGAACAGEVEAERGGSCGGDAGESANSCGEVSPALRGSARANSRVAATATATDTLLDESNADSCVDEDAGRKREGTGTPPRTSAATARSTRSSPLLCAPSCPRDASSSPRDASGVVFPQDDTAGERRKPSPGAAATTPAATAVYTPATSLASAPSSQSGCRRDQVLSSIKKCTHPAESPAFVGASNPSASSCSTSPSASPPPSAGEIRRRRSDGHRSTAEAEAAGSPIATASLAVHTVSPACEAERKDLRARHGKCGEPGVSGASAAALGGRKRRAGGEVADQELRATTSCASSPAGNETLVAKRNEKRRRRALALLADSPDFHGVGVSPVGVPRDAAEGEVGTRSGDRRSAARSRGPDDRAKSAAACGGRRSSRRHHGDRGKSACSPQSAAAANTHATRPGGDGSSIGSPPSTGGGRGTDRRGGNKRKRRDEGPGELGGLASADGGPPRGRDGHHSCRLACSPGDHRGDGGLPGRVRGSPGTGAENDGFQPSKKIVGGPESTNSSSNSSSSSSRRCNDKRRAQTTSTASRMGLETPGYSSNDDEAGAGSGAGGGRAGQQHSPASSSDSVGRARYVSCSLTSRFADDRGSTVCGSRRGGAKAYAPAAHGHTATPLLYHVSAHGYAGRHVDGWGVAFFEGKGFRNFCDSLPSALSPVANLICTYPIKTRTVIAHVRMATQGKVRLENVHPFSRELWGSYWIFAHNGDVPSAKDVAKSGLLRTESKRYTTVGTTDSEAVFCYFLNCLLDTFPDGPPSMADVFVELKRLWKELCRETGVIFNFLLGQGGDTLFAGCWPGARPGSEVWNSLYYTVREFPFTTCQLVDDDCEVDFNTVTSPSDRVAVIASAPLTTNEVWCEMAKGDMLAFHGGQPFSSPDEFRRRLRDKAVGISVPPDAARPA